MNSSCAARRGDALCNVYCFYYDTTDRKGPEYQVCFLYGDSPVPSEGGSPFVGHQPRGAHICAGGIPP